MFVSGRVVNVREGATRRGRRWIQFQLIDESAGVLRCTYWPADGEVLREFAPIVAGVTRVDVFRGDAVLVLKDIQVADGT